MTSVSSGLSDLDRFLGGFQTGDNVVWVAEAGTFVNVFVEGQSMKRWKVEGNGRCELLWLLA